GFQCGLALRGVGVEFGDGGKPGRELGDTLSERNLSRSGGQVECPLIPSLASPLCPSPNSAQQVPMGSQKERVGHAGNVIADAAPGRIAVERVALGQAFGVM